MFYNLQISWFLTMTFIVSGRVEAYVQYVQSQCVQSSKLCDSVTQNLPVPSQLQSFLLTESLKIAVDVKDAPCYP